MLMNLEELKDPAISGLIGAFIGLVITYGVHAALISSEDITWALYAVGMASFFSAGFGVYFNRE
jgi:bacteriorhodopsin